ncbi:HAD hydrolase family protein [Blautia sp.]
MLDLGLDVELADAETTSLEISTKGIHKEIGLSRLCEYLHIPLSQTIVVGDADNDAAALQAAGLPVAMANAKDRIKALADVITMQDNDHDGCAEVIQKYLLS